MCRKLKLLVEQRGEESSVKMELQEICTALYVCHVACEESPHGAVQVIGLVGSSRKRTLMLWQAVELSRVMDRPNLATLQIARKALEPPDDPFEQVPFIYYAVSCSAVLQCAVLPSAML